MTDNLMTRQQAADYLQISPLTLDRWVRDGRLTKYKIVGLQSVRFKRTDVEALLVPDNEEAATVSDDRS